MYKVVEISRGYLVFFSGFRIAGPFLSRDAAESYIRWCRRRM